MPDATSSREHSKPLVPGAAINATEVQHWQVHRLTPYARNPRRNDDAIDRMAASIQEFGFKIPVLARGSGEVVDGHLRLKAARKLGMTELEMESDSEGERHGEKKKADADGRYVSAMLPYKQGSPRGTLKVTLKSAGCSPSIKVPWVRSK